MVLSIQLGKYCVVKIGEELFVMRILGKCDLHARHALQELQNGVSADLFLQEVQEADILQAVGKDLLTQRGRSVITVGIYAEAIPRRISGSRIGDGVRIDLGFRILG